MNYITLLVTEISLVVSDLNMEMYLETVERG
jgi:hypothetical protein